MFYGDSEHIYLCRENTPDVDFIPLSLSLSLSLSLHTKYRFFVTYVLLNYYNKHYYSKYSFMLV